MFREQIWAVSQWFDRWTSCEQTIAMVALMRRLSPTQARFLTSVLHRQLTLADCAELRRGEILANDPNFVASLAKSESVESLMRDLLTYLPLLKCKNTDVKNLYLALVTKVMNLSLENVVDHSVLQEQARQLLSYSLVHPAFTPDDRGVFRTWLNHFEKMGNSNMNNCVNESLNHYPSSLRDSPPSMQDFGNSWQPNNPPANCANNIGSSGTPTSQSGIGLVNFGSTNFQRIRRSNSLTPPVLHSESWNSQEEICLSGSGKPRSLSLSSEVSPQGSLSGSGCGSDPHLNDLTPTFNSPGMKDVPSWLKSLRLHKYAFLFAHLTFEEMMKVSEEFLEKQGITRGARHKIVLSIAKLRDRPNHLKQIFDELTSDKESVRTSLTEIKWMLTTPIKPMHLNENDQEGNNSGSGNGGNSTIGEGSISSGSSSQEVGAIGSNRYKESNSSGDKPADWGKYPKDNEEDLPEMIMRVIAKACEQNPDIECEGLLVSILDKCLAHDAFAPKQKRILSLWRQQQAPVARRNSSGHHSHFSSHRSNVSPGGTHGSSKHRHFSPRVLNFSSQLGNNGIGSSNHPQQAWTSTAMFMAKRPSLQDSNLESARSHISVQRTKSAPLPCFFSSLTAPINFESMNSQNSGGMLGGLDFPSMTSGLGTSESCGSSNNQSGASPMNITSQLESLCLSMTEAALGPAFNNY